MDPKKLTRQERKDFPVRIMRTIFEVRQQAKVEKEAAAPASPSVKAKGYGKWRKLNVRQESSGQRESELKALIPA